MFRATITTLLIAGCCSMLSAQILVFVDGSKELDRHFVREYYPIINEIAKGLDIDILKLDIRNGAPDEITLTPQLAFQNEYGRSFYVGRYSEISRFKVFLRTVSRNPQQNRSNIKNDILSYSTGRASVALPVKITEVTGSYTGDKLDFYNSAQSAFNSAFEKFKLSETFDLKRTDRLFYLDVHPFVSEKDVLYLTYEVYSQFNCVTPIYSRLSDPLVGKVDNYEATFERLGKILEDKVFEISQTAKNGDGFSPVSDDVVLKSWANLGLTVSSENDAKETAKISKDDLSNSWSVAGPVDGPTPILQFNFFPPLDNYAGEVKRLDGEITWNGDKLSGAFEVVTSDVTMGEDTYDKNVHKKYIKVKRFPRASFLFNDFRLNKEALLTGDADTYIIPGNFTFMGKAQAITAASQLIPFTATNGEINLLIRSEFDLNIYEHSKVKGPDGPKEARENMHFQLNFVMSQENRISNNNLNSKSK